MLVISDSPHCENALTLGAKKPDGLASHGFVYLALKVPNGLSFRLQVEVCAGGQKALIDYSDQHKAFETKGQVTYVPSDVRKGVWTLLVLDTPAILARQGVVGEGKSSWVAGVKILPSVSLRSLFLSSILFPKEKIPKKLGFFVNQFKNFENFYEFKVFPEAPKLEIFEIDSGLTSQARMRPAESRHFPPNCDNIFLDEQSIEENQAGCPGEPMSGREQGRCGKKWSSPATRQAKPPKDSE